ncbi:MAG: hypothetical protein OXC44_02205 [Proteobacteria bacterium]|nr:hypothetical protein [Pseudomonadota bacterium]
MKKNQKKTRSSKQTKQTRKTVARKTVRKKPVSSSPVEAGALDSTASPLPANSVIAADVSLTFEERAERFAEFLFNNRMTLLVLSAPVLVIVLGFWGWSIWDNAQTESRLDELAVLNSSYNERRETHQSLREDINDLSRKEAAEGADKDLQKTKELQEQRERLQKELAEKQKEIADMAQSFSDFFAKNPQSKEGQSAAVRSAHIHLFNDDLSGAEEVLTQLYGYKPRGRFFENGVYPMYAGLLEDLGKFQEALEVVDHALASSYNQRASMQVELLYAKARLGAFLKDKSLVDGVVEVFLAKYKDAPEITLVLALQAVY